MMDRRDFFASAGLLPLAAARAQTAAASPGPNFLILMADQHSPHVLGCHGDRVVRTPNLDRLAARGVTFRSAYCQSPLCVPSRMSFLTGRRPSDIRVWGNGDTLPSDTPTFAHALGAAGYETVLIGRMHFNGMDQWHGFERREVGSLLPIYPGLPMPMPERLMVGARNGSREGVQLAGPGRTAYQAYDAEVTERTTAFLRRKAASSSRPFCAVAGFVLPHSPFICSRAQWDYYLPRVTVPEVPPGYFETLHPAVQRWRAIRGLEKVTAEEVRKARAGYYGLVSDLDDRIGQVLRVLEETGLDRNTVVLYTSDHGEMAGELGMWWKMNCYEGSVSVPLIVSCPSRFQGGRQLSQVVELVDVAATLTDLAGTAPMPSAAGKSLVPLLRNQTAAWRNEAFSEYPAAPPVPAMRMIRRDRWKLIHYEGERPQLFDLEKDPQELRDLGAVPEYARIRGELQERALAGWSAAEIQQVLAQRVAEAALVGKWAAKVKPRPEAQWTPPPGANVFPDPN